MRLKDKVAIVTGAGQGLGLAYAQRFLREGAKVAIAEINAERAEAGLKACEGMGDVTVVETDVSDEASTLSCVEHVIAEFGHVDILINNAGLYYDMDMRDNSLEYLRKQFDVNLHGQWLMIRSVAPHMVERNFGRIVNVSSGAAYIYVTPPMGGEPKFTEVGGYGYSQTKWGVIGLTKFMAGQLGRFGITVNCIAPGITMTEATKKVVPEKLLPLVTFMSATGEQLEPEDITGSVVFFASDDAAKITGQLLCVDGGMQMPS